jgi:hypothetical protein
MTAITYDMQKLDEAVGVLATGAGSLQERLSDAFVPLWTLHSGGGMHNAKRAPELARICEALAETPRDSMDGEAARSLASAIAELQSGNWHDAVWALEGED